MNLNGLRYDHPGAVTHGNGFTPLARNRFGSSSSLQRSTRGGFAFRGPAEDFAPGSLSAEMQGRSHPIGGELWRVA